MNITKQFARIFDQNVAVEENKTVKTTELA